jgi:hypothetical protein
MLLGLKRRCHVPHMNEEMQMKFEPPHGSVFGGYGFWSYSSTSHPQPSAANSSPQAPSENRRSATSLRSLAESASRLLRWMRS